jgi:biopolymer transport protein ExbD
MFDDFDSISHKAHIPEPELVPILDALTSVIFFLLLSTTFLELTKITVPPSQTSVVTDPQMPPPRAPKFYVKVQNEKEMQLIIRWAGNKPDSIKKTVPRMADNSRSKELEEAAKDLVTQYKAKYPDPKSEPRADGKPDPNHEKSLQLTFSENATYQELISVMDGIRVEMEDIVLLSPEDMKVGE